MSKTANWTIVLGIALLFLGLCIIAAAWGSPSENDIYAPGMLVFSLGSLAIGLGLYLKARTVSSTPAVSSPVAAIENGRRVRGGCELCGSETPVIQCKTHQLQICGGCLSQHYDPRSCFYMPSVRKATATPASKTMSAKSHA